METDQICKTLGNQAITREKANLDRAAANYNSALGLHGSCEMITLKNPDGEELRIYTKDIFPQITQQLLTKRKDKICAKEVADFLKSVESFQSHIHHLEQHQD